MYLTGAYRQSQVAQLVALGVGVMLQPGSGYARAVEPAGFPAWAADNGCFAQGERFKLERFYAWLESVPRSRLLFAVAPDVFPDAEATLERSRPVLKELRARGYPAAFVAQNDAERGEIPWDEFDCLFLGGETRWKLGAGARALTEQARREGKWVHMGRVNSERRLRYATLIGCDSADGTFLRFRNRGGADGSRDLAGWLHQSVLTLAPAR
jgi:hypothetical protein